MTIFKKVVLVLTLAFATLSAHVAAAQNYTDGLVAYVRDDYATALKVFKPLAEQGNALAQFYLGKMYENGEGVAQDDEQAVTWYSKAAEQGNAAARNYLVPIAERGNASAQFYLGKMYENGEGVAQDDEQAVTWYRKANIKAVLVDSLQFMRSTSLHAN